MEGTQVWTGLEGVEEIEALLVATNEVWLARSR